jgi:signal peptidase II
MDKIKNLVRSSAFFLLLVLFDQLFKHLIRLKGGFYLCNPGIAWGIKLPAGLFWFFWIVIVFFILFLIYQEAFKKTRSDIFFLFALLLILGGTIGNLIDRLFLGCIIDYIDLKIWPIFNLADVFIVIGVIIVIIKTINKK